MQRNILISDIPLQIQSKLLSKHIGIFYFGPVETVGISGREGLYKRSRGEWEEAEVKRGYGASRVHKKQAPSEMDKL